MVNPPGSLVKKPSIVFLHGLFVTRACWDPWIARFEERDHRCFAPTYPRQDPSALGSRARHRDAATSAEILPAVLDHIEKVIRGVDRAPILIGHGFGGLLTQLLLQRQLGACGVAIGSFPPRGVLSLRWSILRWLLPAWNPLSEASRPYRMSFSRFRYAFVPTRSPAEQRRIHDEQVVPESRHLMRAVLSRHARVDCSLRRPPLLLIAGSEDRCVPASVSRANWKCYRSSPSITDFQEFADRDHYVLDSPGWDEIADYALEWAQDDTTSDRAEPHRPGSGTGIEASDLRDPSDGAP